jgi:hypothetical protein
MLHQLPTLQPEQRSAHRSIVFACCLLHVCFIPHSEFRCCWGVLIKLSLECSANLLYMDTLLYTHPMASCATEASGCSPCPHGLLRRPSCHLLRHQTPESAVTLHGCTPGVSHCEALEPQACAVNCTRAGSTVEPSGFHRSKFEAVQH